MHFTCSARTTKSKSQLCKISVALLDQGEIVPFLGAMYKVFLTSSKDFAPNKFFSFSISIDFVLSIFIKNTSETSLTVFPKPFKVSLILLILNGLRDSPPCNTIT